MHTPQKASAPYRSRESAGASSWNRVAWLKQASGRRIDRPNDVWSETVPSEERLLNRAGFLRGREAGPTSQRVGVGATCAGFRSGAVQGITAALTAFTSGEHARDGPSPRRPAGPRTPQQSGKGGKHAPGALPPLAWSAHRPRFVDEGRPGTLCQLRHPRPKEALEVGSRPSSERCRHVRWMPVVPGCMGLRPMDAGCNQKRACKVQARFTPRQIEGVGGGRHHHGPHPERRPIPSPKVAHAGVK
ncbi:MAG: hypothetical protein CM15mP128_5270 [Methanobacteriota archaeon]|nr:MAG: hypothetical protein CM15mP128_5270 [Euryarchaeota archaeon]